MAITGRFRGRDVHTAALVYCVIAGTEPYRRRRLLHNNHKDKAMDPVSLTLNLKSAGVAYIQVLILLAH